MHRLQPLQRARLWGSVLSYHNADEVMHVFRRDFHPPNSKTKLVLHKQYKVYHRIEL